MQLLRTSQMLDTSERHLQTVPATNLDRLEIESYLAQMATVIFFAEMEERLKEIVRDRLQDGGDRKLAHFLSKLKDSEMSRMKRREISETVGLFGDECKEEFKNRFPAGELEVYSNVIADRHQASHAAGSDVTLIEVRSAAQIAERILVAIKEVIA